MKPIYRILVKTQNGSTLNNSGVERVLYPAILSSKKKAIEIAEKLENTGIVVLNIRKYLNNKDYEIVQTRARLN